MSKTERSVNLAASAIRRIEHLLWEIFSITVGKIEALCSNSEVD